VEAKKIWGGACGAGGWTECVLAVLVAVLVELVGMLVAVQSVPHARRGGPALLQPGGHHQAHVGHRKAARVGLLWATTTPHGSRGAVCLTLTQVAKNAFDGRKCREGHSEWQESVQGGLVHDTNYVLLLMFLYWVNDNE